MKITLVLLMVLHSLLLASPSDKEASDKKKRIEQQIQKELEKEAKYSREQTFYQGQYYDFKGAEVNKDSLDSIPNIEVQDDFDMDSVYD